MAYPQENVGIYVHACINVDMFLCSNMSYEQDKGEAAKFVAISEEEM